jgi:cytochrome P450
MNLPPGPRGAATLGFFGLAPGRTRLDFLLATARQYGPISSFRVLNKRICVVDDPTIVEDILVRRQHCFARGSARVLLRELLGNGLVTSEEPLHRQRRRMMQPAFHRAQIASYAEAMKHEARRAGDAWSMCARIDLSDEMRRLTLGVVGSALFGADMHQSAGAVAAVVARVVKKSTWLVLLSVLLEPVFAAYRRGFPHAPRLVFGNERLELERILAPIISRHRGKGGRDILSLLLAERDERGDTLNDEDIRNEVVSLVLAGHETTATALTWACYLLATHPHVVQKLEAELDRVLGDRDPSLDDIPRLTYAANVFAETLRLYPSASAFTRRPLEDIGLGGYTVPSGTIVFLSPYITQRNKRWFPNPDAFEPERWDTATPKFAYFPFGAGAKMCIGESFAKMEGVLVLATIARRMRLELIDQTAVGFAPGVALKPDRPLLMRPILRANRGELSAASA